MKFQVKNPFDQSTITELQLMNEKSVLLMLEEATQLHESHPHGLPPYERIEILKKTAQLLQEKEQEFCTTACLEGGKPITDTQVEIARAIQGIELAAASIAELKGEQIPMDLTPAGVGHSAWTQFEPIGVVTAISAFNHPLNLIVHQVITAVAAGCPVLVKPSLTTPLSCIQLVQLLYQAGLPKVWAQVILCEDTLAERIATDSRTKFLTFIGSHRVGWHLRSSIAPGTRIALEHGGIAPAILEPDSNWQAAIPGLLKAAFYHAGQVCVSLQRLYVHTDIYTDVRNALIEGAKRLTVGNPMNEDTDVGPFILPKELNRVHDWIQEAQREGAIITLGGQAISETTYSPTIIEHASQDSKVSQHEIFGPVICLYKYNDLDKVIQICNDTSMHFQASFFTENINTAMKASQELNANTVLINQHPAFRVDWMPFGGRDLSGLGTGGILQSMKDMSQEKLTILKQL